MWSRWTLIARAIGDLQARLLLLIVYFLVAPPFAVGARLLRGRFGAVSHGGAGLWTERPPTENTLPAASRQY
ncbi:MAG: hypothetical protein DMD95_23405 [Candidatus Rokuibacteriota bacterium]|nr:MAG: hypothetical protein DMD95_23405 [Candidatus Rokubacteria bacterium]